MNIQSLGNQGALVLFCMAPAEVKGISAYEPSVWNIRNQSDNYSVFNPVVFCEC